MPAYIKLGPFYLHWYAILILVCAVYVYVSLNRKLAKTGYDSFVVDELFVGAMLTGVVFARVGYVLFKDFSFYFSNPKQILMFWRGGNSLLAGLAGIVIFAYVYCKVNGYSFWKLADNLLPYGLLVEAIGIWGNYISQQLYLEDTLEVFYYLIINSVLALLGFILLIVYSYTNRHLKRGQISSCYLLWVAMMHLALSIYFKQGIFKILISILVLFIGVAGLTGGFRKMSKKEKPAVIFDFDCTLADTEKAIYMSFEHVLKAHVPELVLSDEDFVSFLGPTLEESFIKYAPGFDPKQLVEEYRKFNWEAQRLTVKEIPGAKKMLTWLKEHDYPLAIASSKRTETIMYGLQLTEMTEFFDEEHVIGVEKVTNPKPDRESIDLALAVCNRSFDNGIYVGDSPSDIVCGHNGGVYTIAMCTNERKREALANVKPSVLIDDLMDIIDIVSKDIEFTKDKN